MAKLCTLHLHINQKLTQSSQNNSSKYQMARQSKHDNSYWNTLTLQNLNTIDSISTTMHISTQENLIKFYHQCLFSPHTSIWIAAINNHHFTGWPGLTATAIQWHLPISMATIKKHAKQPLQNLLSTTKLTLRWKSLQVYTISKGGNPDTSKTIFCWAAIVNANNKIIYIDFAGKFHVAPMKATNTYLLCMTTTLMQSLFARCQAERHLLLSTPSNPSATCLKSSIANHNLCIGQWSIKHHQGFLIQDSINNQFVSPQEHRVNDENQEIQTLKNQFISGSWSTDPNFMQLWRQLTQMAGDTFKMLHIAHDDQTKLAYDYFNIHQWGPPGCKAIVHKHPHTCTSWGPRGSDTWHTGPAKDQNWCYHMDTKIYWICKGITFP